MAGLRLLIVFSGADVTPRLNTLECETRERRGTEPALSRAYRHSQTQEKVTSLVEPMRLLNMLVRGYRVPAEQNN